MASINGITVKCLKKFRGHEGETLYQGKLFLDGKEIGFWSQDSWGGPDSITVNVESRKVSFDDKEKWHDAVAVDQARRSIFNKRVEDFLAGFPDKDENTWRDGSCLMGDLLLLLLDQKEYKKLVNKVGGYAGLVVTDDGYNVLLNAWSCSRKLTSAEVMEHAMSDAGYRKDVLECDWLGNTVVSARAYGSLTDFDLVVDAEHPAPSWMFSWFSSPYSVDVRDQLKAAA